MKQFLGLFLAVITAFAAFAETPVDSVKVYFRVGNRQFEPLLGNNGALMDCFAEKVRHAIADDAIERIEVRAYASPDGSNRFNERLSRERCEAITDQIKTRTDIRPELITQLPGGVAWDELRRMVAANPDVPMREQVLDVLDNTPLWIFNDRNRVIGGRKQRLMSLAGGRPYRWMLKHMFPQLRNAVAATLYFKSDAYAPDAAAAEPQPSMDGSSYQSETPAVSAVVEESVTMMTEPDTADSRIGVDTDQLTATANTDEVSRQLFALKTNILYYGALMPNLELEWLINDNWSVAFEGDVAWWSRPDRHQYYQLAILSPEVRYHIRPRSPWHGMYVGLFGGGGWYDLENGGLGYRGEGGMGGLSFGYMWPIGRHLSLEAGIGAGYMYTRYKEYEPREGHYLYERTKSLNYFGPLKLKLSIAWRFFNVKRSKSNASAL